MPSFVGILEGINIRLLRPVVVSIKPKKDNQAKNDHTKDAEEPEEILHIVTKIGFIVFLVPLPNPFALIIEHFIDLTNMLLHLISHPLAFFGKQFLDFLPVSIIDIYRHL